VKIITRVFHYEEIQTTATEGYIQDQPQHPPISLHLALPESLQLPCMRNTRRSAPWGLVWQPGFTRVFTCILPPGPLLKKTLGSPFGILVSSRVSPSKIAKTRRIDGVPRREERDAFFTLVNWVLGAYSPKNTVYYSPKNTEIHCYQTRPEW
jgi:hypothetical protein